MRLSRIVIDGVALIAAALIVPGHHSSAWSDEPTQTLITLVVLAVVFGVINAYIRPVLRAVSLPVNLLSMGLFGFFLNAGLLLLLAWLVDKSGSRCSTSATSRPTFDVETLTAAVADRWSSPSCPTSCRCCCPMAERP